jgi:hypothetical protein
MQIDLISRAGCKVVGRDGEYVKFVGAFAAVFLRYIERRGMEHVVGGQLDAGYRNRMMGVYYPARFTVENDAYVFGRSLGMCFSHFGYLPLLRLQTYEFYRICDERTQKVS